MPNSQFTHLNVEAKFGHHGKNNNLVSSNEVPLVDPNGVPAADPVNANSQVAININLPTDLENSVRGGPRSTAREAPKGEGDGVSLRLIFEMLQAQQAAIVQLQNQSHAPNRVEPERSRESSQRDEQIIERPSEAEPVVNPKVMNMLEELTKRVESGEKKIQVNDNKVETYNSGVDQIPRAPPILNGPDSKRFIQKPFPLSAAPKPIPKIFCMPYIPKYNETTDPNEHVTSYRCVIKGDYLEEDEIESVLLKKFGKILSKGAMIWCHNLPPNSIDSFSMLADAFVKAHAGAIKVETRKLDLFKVKQRDNEMLREFVSRFQMKRMDLPPIADDWASFA
ncbi:uncharacterized protein [Nicotiana tomentosiformis]|uniref:uncharacterized protein n=1 Tax=Nicotiana tomentosiformis TaxID=4098 RepID=UPI00388C869B